MPTLSYPLCPHTALFLSSLAQRPEHLRELASVPAPAASGLLEYTLAAERVWRAPLRGVRLVVALRHAGIADQIGVARHPASFTNGRIRRWKQDAPISADLGLSQSSFIQRAQRSEEHTSDINSTMPT